MSSRASARSHRRRAGPEAPGSGNDGGTGGPAVRLRASTTSLAALRELPVWTHGAGAAETEHVVTTCFDTADGMLARGGLVLRGAGEGAGAGPLRRCELLAVGGRPVPAALGPLFAVRFERVRLTVALADAVVEMVLDEGAVEAGSLREPLAEVGLHARSGDPGAVFELGLSLLETAPLCIEGRSEIERGLALVLGHPPAGARAERLDIGRTDTVDDAIVAILRNCLSHLTGNLAAAEDGRDPEGVHQVRVALRRLRTALWIVRQQAPAPMLKLIADEARHLGRTLGAARSWDVFLTETLEKAGGSPDQRALLRGIAEAPHADACAVVRETLAAPRTTRFILLLGRTIEHRNWRADIDTDLAFDRPVTEFAAAALARIRRRAIRLGRGFAGLSPDERHRLRLALKKLRYAADFFVSLFGDAGGGRRFSARLSKLQARLGDDNDIATMRPVLDEILRRSAEREDVGDAVAALAARQEERRASSAARLRRAWRRFKRTPPFWENRRAGHAELLAGREIPV